jgi:hypothetical protein
LPDNQFHALSAKYHGNDVIDGGSGNDEIIGGGGDDVLIGGDEVASGNTANDVIYGDLGVGIYDKANINKGETDILASQTEWYGKDLIFGGAVMIFWLVKAVMTVLMAALTMTLFTGIGVKSRGFISTSSINTVAMTRLMAAMAATGSSAVAVTIR